LAPAWMAPSPGFIFWNLSARGIFERIFRKKGWKQKRRAAGRHIFFTTMIDDKGAVRASFSFRARIIQHTFTKAWCCKECPSLFYRGGRVILPPTFGIYIEA
jgi:hypothetical protein